MPELRTPPAVTTTSRLLPATVPESAGETNVSSESLDQATVLEATPPTVTAMVESCGPKPEPATVRVLPPATVLSPETELIVGAAKESLAGDDRKAL